MHREELELLNDPFYYYKQVAFISLVLGTLIIFPFMFRELFVNSKRFIFLYYGDYNVQQVPFYRHCVEMVHNGNFGWDWNTDLGSNFMGSYSYYMLGSPFFWMLCLFPSSWTPYLMGPMFVIKYVAAAVIAYAFFKRFVKNKNYAVIGALLYSFCGFQIYNVFFNQFQEVVALFPLMLIGMEELVQNNRKGVFAIAVALNCMCNYFMFYGQVVFCLIYFFMRCLQKSYRITLKKFLLLAFESVLGVALGAIMFIPACLGVMGNFRLNYSFSDTKSMLIYLKNNETYIERYGHILQSYFFPPDIPSRVNFFYGHTTRWSSNAAWLPVFGLAGVFAYIKTRLRSTIGWLIIVLMGFSLVPILNSAFYNFNSNYYARWIYMLVLVAIIATIIALEDDRIKWNFGIIVNTAAIVIITTYCGLRWYNNTEKSNLTYALGGEPFSARLWISVAIALACMAGLFFVIKRYRKTKYFANIVLVFVCVTIVVYGVVHIYCGLEHSGDTARIVKESVEGEINIDDDDFYRIDFFRADKLSVIKVSSDGKETKSEVTYTSVHDNLGISWEIPSVECFHTVVPPSIMDFYENIGVTRNVASRADYAKYGLLGFLSVKYSFIRSSSAYKHVTSADNTDFRYKDYIYAYDGLSFDYYDTQNNYDIFENNYYISPGFYYEYFMTESQFEKVSKSLRHTLLCKYLVVPDDEAEYYAQFMTEAVKSEEPNSTQVKCELANNETYIKSVNERRLCTCDTFVYDSYSFTAEITMEKDNLVMFTVPYEEGWNFFSGGWTATVNGKEVEVHKVTYGFMAVECSGAEDGHYVIKFNYSTPGLKAGIIATSGGIVIFTLYMIIVRKKKLRPDYKFFKEDYVEIECPSYNEGYKSEANKAEENYKPLFNYESDGTS